MAKLTDAELTAITQAELEKLMEEVKQRTKTTITGVKIPELTETTVPTAEDIIIVEQADGTKKMKTSNLSIQEVIEARTPLNGNAFTNLKERLDSMEKAEEDIAQALNMLKKEVDDAKVDANGAVSNTLKDRLDSIVAGGGNANSQEVVDARTDADGTPHNSLTDRLNSDAQKVKANEQEITVIKNTLATMDIKYTVI